MTLDASRIDVQRTRSPDENATLRRELAALRRSEALLRDFIETSSVSLHWVGEDGTILWANQAELDLLGYKQDEYVGRNIAEFHADKDTIENILSCLKSGGTLKDCAARLKCKDGSTRDVLISSSALFEEGKFVHTRCFTRDVTDLVAKSEASNLLAAIVDSSEDAIISKDLNGVITSWNKSAERLFGYTATEAVGKTVAELLIPADKQNEEPDILKRLRRGERVEHFQTVRQRKDGTLLDISLTISPIKDGKGRVIGASKIARDITQQKRTEDDLRRVNADLEQFSYSASHDLQEPLRTIKIYSELLNLGGLSQEDQTQFLAYLRGAAIRMEGLIKDLLSYTQLSKPVSDAVYIDANAVLSSVLSNLKGSIEASGADIKHAYLPMVKIDGTHLKLLFQNLISNAIKYRSDGQPPRIEISTRQDDGQVIFSVADNGIGIQSQYREKIFALFSRLHTNEKYPGTGIGLAICKKIVDRYGGRIWVESEPGRGSTFCFTVPA